MSNYKIYYFNGRGRAEAARLIFIYADKSFEDVRFEENDWPKYKPNMPLGQVPVLEVDGFKIPQSIAICRYLAKLFNLAGEDILEQVKVDVVADTLTDLVNKYAPIIWEEDDEVKKKEKIELFLKNELPWHLKNLEKLGLNYSKSNFFVGEKLTWVDLYVYDMLQNIIELNGNILNDYKWLKDNRKAVENHPKIANYLQNRPKTLY